MKKSEEQRWKDDVWLLFEEAKRRNGFKDTDLCRYMGLGLRAMKDRQADPGKINLYELEILLKLTNRKLKFPEAV